MNIFKEINAKIQDVFNPANLKIAIMHSLNASEAIKNRVRDKLAKLTEENKQRGGYANLLVIHAEIEKNHDTIHARPDTGVNPQSAKDDCTKILFKQEELENTFNVAYAEVTSDPAVLVENEALQAERNVRDAETAIEQTKNEAIDAANKAAADAKELAVDAKEHVLDAKDTVIETATDFGHRVGNAAEDVKEAFTSSKPRI